MHASYTIFQHVYEMFLPKKLQTQASKGKDEEPPPPPFAGMKLKPKRPVQRKPVEEPQNPFKVELKHHEFEKPPQNEEVTLRRLYTVTEHYNWTLMVFYILIFMGYLFP